MWNRAIIVSERTDEAFWSICSALLQNVVITGIDQTVAHRNIPGKRVFLEQAGVIDLNQSEQIPEGKMKRDNPGIRAIDQAGANSIQDRVIHNKLARIEGPGTRPG